MTSRSGYPPNTRPMRYDTPKTIRRTLRKCSYCATVHSREECPNCGAPLKDHEELDTR